MFNWLKYIIIYSKKVTKTPTLKLYISDNDYECNIILKVCTLFININGNSHRALLWIKLNSNIFNIVREFLRENRIFPIFLA